MRANYPCFDAWRGGGQMQELDKILEEIELEKKRVSLSRDCSNEHAVIEISLLEKIEDIIRKCYPAN